jgi:rubrerythrin
MTREINRSALEQQTPMPTDDGQKPAPAPKRSRIDTMKDSLVEAEELKMIRSVLAEDTGRRGSEGLSPEIANILVQTTNSYSTALTQLMTNLMTIQNQGKQATGQDPFMQYLIGEVQTMKAKLDAPGQDPLEVVDEVQKKMLGWEDQMRKRLGVGDVGASVQNMSAMIELEKIRSEATDRQNQFNLMFAAMQQQWRREDRRWELEFRVKTHEANSEAESREKALGAFQDLGASLIESMGEGENVVEQVRDKPRQRPSQNQPAGHTQGQDEPPLPKVFTCPRCGHTGPVPDDMTSDSIFECPGCNAEYDWELKEM